MKKKLESLEEELKDKEDELEGMKCSNSVMLILDSPFDLNLSD